MQIYVAPVGRSVEVIILTQGVAIGLNYTGHTALKCIYPIIKSGRTHRSATTNEPVLIEKGTHTGSAPTS